MGISDQFKNREEYINWINGPGTMASYERDIKAVCALHSERLFKEGKKKKYTVDVFCPQSVGTNFPENTYDVNTIEEVSKIIKDCSKKIAGIRQVQIWINGKDE